MKRNTTCWECAFWIYNGSGQEGECSGPNEDTEGEMTHQDYSCNEFCPMHGNFECFHNEGFGAK